MRQSHRRFRAGSARPVERIPVHLFHARRFLPRISQMNADKENSYPRSSVYWFRAPEDFRPRMSRMNADEEIPYPRSSAKSAVKYHHWLG
jgi:hypothetical protein